MAALIGGGRVLQWPIGRLSDFVDRRFVIIGLSVAGTVAAVFAPQATAGPEPWMVVGVGLLGALTFTLHSLNLARTNDCLSPDEMIQASSALVLLLGFGSIVGPLAVGLIMSMFGPPGYFYWLVGVQLLFVLFTCRGEASHFLSST